MSRRVGADIIEGWQDALAYLEDRPSAVRVSSTTVPESVNVREVRQAVGATQAEFSARFGIPVDTVRKWERGARQPDAAARAYLTVILKNPKLVEDVLGSP